MRSAFLLLGVVVLMALGYPAAGTQEQTASFHRDGNSVVAGNARFQVLSPTLIRMELAPDGQFVDSPSAIVVKRDWPLPEFEASEQDGWLTIRAGGFELRYRLGSDEFTPDTLSVTWGDKGLWVPGQKDPLNLGGTLRSLDGVSAGNLPELSEGLLSRSGYYFYDDSATPVCRPDRAWIEPRGKSGSVDWYLFVYGGDYTLALKEYGELFGSVPMIPEWALGSWYSRYWPYHDWELKDIVNEYRRRHIPIDVLVIDVDWHTNGWEGYDWNSEYFPDSEGFLKWCHDQGVKVTLNNHPSVLLEESNTPEARSRLGLGPADEIRFNLATKLDADVYMDVLHNPMLDRGVDFWWIDGQAAAMEGLNGQFWTNRVYYDGTEDHTGKRSLIFSRWGGPGSHRYPIGFSGDTIAGWEVLKYEVAMTPVAGNLLWQWSHDIGGFIGDKIDDELYLRWVQFGAFSPALRMHSDHGQRLPWDYSEEIAGLARDAFQLRYRLIPYTYTLFRDLSENAVSPCRPLYLEYPELEAAYEYPYEYMFGPEILVIPATEPTADGMTEVPVYLPPGEWFDFGTGRVYSGNTDLVYPCPLDRIPLFVKPGAVIPMQQDVQFVGEKPLDPLIVNVYRGADGEFTLYEDDGVSLDYREGGFARTRVRLDDERDGFTVTVEPAQGDYAGMPQRRSIVLRAFGATRPQSVFLNRSRLEEATDWRIDPETLALEIDLGEHAVHDTLTVKVDNPGGYARYEWLTRARDIRKRLLYAAGESGRYDSLRGLAERIQADSDGVATGDMEPYHIGAELACAAEAILATGETPENTAAAAEVLGFHLYTSVQDAPQFGQANSVVAAASWDQAIEGAPHISLELPAELKGEEVAAGTSEARIRTVLSDPEGLGFLKSEITAHAEAQVGGKSIALSQSIPVENYSVTDWKILGPFDNTDGIGLSTDYGPESGVDLAATYDGLDGPAAWEDTPSEIILGGVFQPRYISLIGRWPRQNVCAYAVTYVYSPSAQDAVFDLGSDDQIVVWLNSDEVFHYNEPRAPAPSQDQVPVRLKQGVNEILVKVCNGGGGWGFYFELKPEDPTGGGIRPAVAGD
jgi:hypothetical protein